MVNKYEATSRKYNLSPLGTFIDVLISVIYFHAPRSARIGEEGRWDK